MATSTTTITSNVRYSNHYVALPIFEKALRDKLGIPIAHQESKKKGAKDFTTTQTDQTVLGGVFYHERNGHTYLSKRSIAYQAENSLTILDKPWGHYYYEDRKAVHKACMEILKELGYEAPPPKSD